MLNNLHIVLGLVLVLFLAGCQSDKKDAYKGMSAAEIYAQAEKNMNKEKFPQASKDFEALEARYPYGEYSDRAQLGLMNAYYKQNEPTLAISTADRFIRMHPENPNVDYAYYLRGLVAFDQNYGFTFRYFPLDRSLRNPSSLEESFEYFKELIDRFPNSEYAPDARQRMVFLRNALANHELHVAKYYMKRKAYVSAADRANTIIRKFERTPAVPKALAILISAYEKLDMPELANDARKTLEHNYPKPE